MSKLNELPVVPFAIARDFEAWLGRHHASEDGIWIKMAKKTSGIPSITHDQALDVALCYGWIDSQRLGRDEVYFLQKFTPRRSRSQWSVRNAGKVEQLIATGKMQQSGRAEIEAAIRDGRLHLELDG